MFVKLKQCLRKNSKINFWVELYKNRKDKMFQDYVTAFGGSDSVWLSHPGTLYPEHLVYCITNHKGDMGFFGEVCRTLRRLAYAEIYHLTPVINWRQDCPYKENGIIHGTDNVFEFYFMPVSNINYKDIMRCKNLVYYANAQASALGGYTGGGYIEQEEMVLQFAKLYQKYFNLNQQTRSYIEENRNDKIGGKKTLGVHIRGTDFKVGFNSHPVYIPPKDYLVKVKELFEEYGCERVFLATDSVEAIKVFQDEFYDMLIFYEEIRRSDGKKGLHCLDAGRKNHHYLLGLEVLRDAYTLAACDVLLAGMSNVSFGAQFIKMAEGKKYEKVAIMNYGINHNKVRA